MKLLNGEWVSTENVLAVYVGECADVAQLMIPGMSPLQIACQNGRLEITQLLLKKGADVFQATRDGVTALAKSEVQSLLSSDSLRITLRWIRLFAVLHADYPMMLQIPDSGLLADVISFLFKFWQFSAGEREIAP